MFFLAAMLAAAAGCGAAGDPPADEAVLRGPERPERFTNSIGIGFVRIPAGTFRMGGEPDEPDSPELRPAGPVTISRDYYLAVHTVTNGQFRRFRPDHDSGYHEGRDAQGTLNGADQPAVRVSWEDAAAFCAWLSGLEAEREAGRSYRLSTEAEWERAARAGRGWRFPWGDDWPAGPGDANLLREDRADEFDLAAPVGSFPPNPYGLHDMAGNVWEWTADWHATRRRDGDAEAREPSPHVTDPTGPPGGTEKIVKGASWDHHSRQKQRSAARDHLPPDSAWYDVGFRIVCEFDR